MIEVEGLGKSYLIGHQGRRKRYTALRDVLAGHARNLWKRTRQAMRGQTTDANGEMEQFWALKDVSFQVERGDVVGIIGRNGAGKSTLLKILSRITEPTEGRATLRGRVASLLEVGTGFHPELTGRENIFLNGAILGMTRAEIKRKFDEIVAFAEVEKFLDTPVKRYSSGMYVRLAFAVAAHLEPEILVVDEVLAVGDAEFQKKCLGKMGEVARGGRTVLFVSHNMAAVRRLCPRSVLLASGRVVATGDTENVVSRYESIHAREGTSAAERCVAPGIDFTVQHVRTWQENGSCFTSFALRGMNEVPQLGVGIELCSSTQVTVAKLRPVVTRLAIPKFSGDRLLTIELPQILTHLVSGEYSLHLWFAETGVSILARIEDAARINIPPHDAFATGIAPTAGPDGYISVKATVELSQVAFAESMA